MENTIIMKEEPWSPTEVKSEPHTDLQNELACFSKVFIVKFEENTNDSVSGVKLEIMDEKISTEDIQNTLLQDTKSLVSVQDQDLNPTESTRYHAEALSSSDSNVHGHTPVYLSVNSNTEDETSIQTEKFIEIQDISFDLATSFKDYSFVRGSKKPHRCNMCKKNFKLIPNFKAHYLLHKKNNPHKCKACDEKFLQMSDLLVHNNSAHQHERLCKCQLCDKTFTSASGLVYHLELTQTM